jgi:predicted metalloprotease with PDZ domain
MKILSLLIAFNLSFSIAGAADLTPASEQLIDDLKVNIQNTLIAIGENEKRAGKKPEDVHFSLNLPAQQLTNLGIVLDVDNPTTGYSVLAVSPGSEAEALGIAVGSKIVRINDIVISRSTAESALQQLQDLTAGEKVTLAVENNNMIKKIETSLNGQYVPEVRLEVGSYEEADSSQISAYSNKISEEMENACGRVSVFFRPPEARYLFPVYVNKIDDKNVISGSTFRLPPGKHLIKMN